MTGYKIHCMWTRCVQYMCKEIREKQTYKMDVSELPVLTWQDDYRTDDVNDTSFDVAW